MYEIMDIEYAAFQALIALRNYDVTDADESRNIALRYLESSLKYCNESATQTKDMLLDFARDSGMTKFKLIGRVNTSGMELMEWCDDAYNFDWMCSSVDDLKRCKNGDYIRRTYSLCELPDVIDNALLWYNSNKRNNHYFNSTMLHILAVDDIE